MQKVTRPSERRYVAQVRHHDFADDWWTISGVVTFWIALETLEDRAEYERRQQAFGIENSDRSYRITDLDGTVVMSPRMLRAFFGPGDSAACSREAA